jgi:hypothetical protein
MNSQNISEQAIYKITFEQRQKVLSAFSFVLFEP